MYTDRLVAKGKTLGKGRRFRREKWQPLENGIDDEQREGIESGITFDGR